MAIAFRCRLISTTPSELVFFDSASSVHEVKIASAPIRVNLFSHKKPAVV
jgi:hypothetical protein